MRLSSRSKRDVESGVTLHKGIAYAIPHAASVFLMAPMVILQGIYAKYYGLSLSAIAGVVLLSRLFDAISDPLVGYYSDVCYAKYGTRKPFMIAGGVVLSLAGYLLYIPPDDVSIGYFTIWSLLRRFDSTAFKYFSPFRCTAVKTCTVVISSTP